MITNNNVFERLGKEAHAFAVADGGPLELKHLVYRQKYNDLIIEEVLSLADQAGKIESYKIKEHFGLGSS